MDHLLHGRTVGPQVGQDEIDPRSIQTAFAGEGPADHLGEAIGLLVDVPFTQVLDLLLEVGAESGR
ncbi:MAG: hypothetical protein KL785_09430 [Brevundimonas sp.]|nr:hypothetical protein [Brevundimonas sp.]